ncbi:hypothetical protein LSAT2_016535 [Lamellibrachia satsuma]|nr:hypothetical protein LSAT2_016535 [Lamellibrachia satsuma]
MAMLTNGNGHAASSSNMRLQGLCLPETDGIRLREHSTSSRNSQQSAKRMFKREHFGAIFTGIAVLLFGRYYFKTSIEDKRQATGHRAGDNIDTDTYIDPHRKCKGKLIRFKADEPFWLPEEFLNQYKLNQVTQFPVDDTDIFVVSFPKSGTTWLQEIVFLLHTVLDFKKATETNLDARFPHFEDIYPGIETIARSTPPRLVKSHLPYDFMPDGVKQGHGKVVYIARNPRDVCVSFFHFACMRIGFEYQGSFKDLYKTFVSGKAQANARRPKRSRLIRGTSRSSPPSERRQRRGAYWCSSAARYSGVPS